jgi:hypothetical protein
MEVVSILLVLPAFASLLTSNRGADEWCPP